MRLFAILLLLGVLSGQYFIADKLFISLLFLIVSLYLVITSWSKFLVGIHQFAMTLGIFLFGVNVFIWHMDIYQKSLWPKEAENKKIWITGEIISVPSKNNLQQTFLIKLNDQKIIQLHTHDQNNYHIGDVWSWQVKIKRPHGYHNPGSFNGENKAYQEHLSGIAYVPAHAEIKLLKQKNHLYFLQQIRIFLQNFIEENLAANDMLGLIEGLTIGNTQHISQAQWQVLRNTGTSHLLAISGLHIGLVALLTGKLIRPVIAGLFHRYFFSVPLCFLTQGFGVLCATFYAFISGLSLPTQRTLIMLLVGFMMSWRRRIYPLGQGLAISLVILILWDPFNIFSLGFWLSFLAVACINYLMVQPNLNYFKMQIGVTLGLMPISLYFFQQVSLTAIIVNLFAIPWLNFVVVPACLISLIFFSDTLLHFAANSLFACWSLMSWFSSIPNTQFYYAFQSFYSFISLCIAIFLMLAPIKIGRSFILIFLLLLPIFLQKPFSPKQHQWWIDVLDVGQGLAVVIQTQNHVLIYDTGPSYQTGWDAGSAIIIPFLRTRHINQIDTLIISHRDNDHSGGAESLVKYFSIGHIYAHYFPKFAFEKIQLCLVGKEWDWDGIHFKFLSPHERNLLSGNNSSCVLKIDDGKNSILLPGDIEKETEQWLLQSKQNLKSTILIAPHHGSRTSSTENFVEAVNAQYVVFSTGYQNRFHFPHPLVLKQYKNTYIFNTAEHGAVHFDIEKEKNTINFDAFHKSLILF